MSTRAEELANKLASGWPRLEDLNDAVPELRRLAEVERQYLALKASIGEPVAWLSPGRERLEFSRPDTVYGSHTIPLYAIKDNHP